MHNIVDNIKIDQALMPQTINTAAIASSSIDMQGVENMAVVILVGNISETLSTSAKIDLKIEHGDSTSTFTACTDSDVANFSGLTAAGIFTTIDTNAEEQKRYVIEYKGSKRYVKVTATPTGLTTGGPIAMASLKANVSQKPVTNV